ncbi:hypothetical protein WJX81_003939 [Elliptochloris bilobata]|uniref:Uncharacterized protein n=1 Tax=Elliptochloris bilobata TaxID=381761 RepID=A0AAW1QUZ7_9CHLO
MNLGSLVPMCTGAGTPWFTHAPVYVTAGQMGYTKHNFTWLHVFESPDAGLYVIDRGTTVPLADGAMHGIRNGVTGWLAGADVVTHHPAEVSSVILLGVALLLSPYLLAGLVILLLVTGVPRLPAMLRPALPSPIVEAQSRLADARDRVVGPLAAASER